MCPGLMPRSRERPPQILLLMERLKNPLLIPVLQMLVPLVAALTMLRIVLLPLVLPETTTLRNSLGLINDSLVVKATAPLI